MIVVPIDLGEIDVILDLVDNLRNVDINDHVQFFKQISDWEGEQVCVEMVRKFVRWEEKRNHLQADVDRFVELTNLHIAHCEKLSKLASISEERAHNLIEWSITGSGRGRDAHSSMIFYLSETRGLRETLLNKRSAARTLELVFGEYGYMKAFAGIKARLLHEEYIGLVDKTKNFLFDF